jgi:hypothetical protein
MDSDDDDADDDGSRKYPTLPMKQMTNPTKAAEEFFRRQEAAEMKSHYKKPWNKVGTTKVYWMMIPTRNTLRHPLI